MQKGLNANTIVNTSPVAKYPWRTFAEYEITWRMISSSSASVQMRVYINFIEEGERVDAFI